jgi:hypothetical protein
LKRCSRVRHFPSRFSKDLRLSMIRGCRDPQWRPARRRLDPRGGARRHRPAVPRREGRALTSLPRTSSPGGADRSRTGDLLVANQALSQLSYSPGKSRSGGPKWIRTTDLTVISRALYQLSYRPVVPLIRPAARRSAEGRGGRLPKSIAWARGPKRVAP